MLVVDSSVWIDFFNGAPSPGRATLRRLLADGDAEIMVPDLVLYEVLRGFRHERDYLHAEALLTGFTLAATGGEALARQAARHYRHLRAAGITVRSAIDVLLAAFCIQHGHTLLHADRDFDAFEATQGLRAWRH
jgi:predicted nucleic acid-binding protein